MQRMGELWNLGTFVLLYCERRPCLCLPMTYSRISRPPVRRDIIASLFFQSVQTSPLLAFWSVENKQGWVDGVTLLALRPETIDLQCGFVTSHNSTIAYCAQNLIYFFHVFISFLNKNMETTARTWSDNCTPCSWAFPNVRA